MLIEVEASHSVSFDGEEKARDSSTPLRFAQNDKRKCVLLSVAKGQRGLAALTALFCHSEMEDRKQLLRIDPTAREMETGWRREPCETFRRVLVGKFRDDFLARRKIKFIAADADGLARSAD